ncbi:MAG: hypothetical protein AB8H86_25195 [Polyangiales bacterium]
MRFLLVLVLACSGAPSADDVGDASVDVLSLGLSAPGADPSVSTVVEGPALAATSPARLTQGLAAEQLAAHLASNRAWMWSATLVPDVPEGPIELALPPQYGLAPSTRLARVALFQSVAVDVARDGAALSASAPIIADRALRVRAYVEDGAGSLVLGRLRWESAGTTTLFVGSMHVEGPSSDEDPESLFEFVVPKELVSADATFAVDILEDEGESFANPSQARFPMDGELHRLAAEPRMHIDVRLVPMRYGFDGSMRIPAVGAEELSALREHIEAVFPVSQASVTVLPARDYDAQIGPDDFDEHVDALHQVIAWRTSDAPPSAVYYVGVVAPAETFGEYCAEGCYAGVAPVNELNSPFQRASVVVWYGASRSGWTALHELGHTQGRAHSPCGWVSGADPDYPHPRGVIGVWGFDSRVGAFLPPTRHDFMSYCGDEWVSDYTYAAMAERTRDLRSLPSIASAEVRRRDPSRRMITTGHRVRWSNIALPTGVVGEATKLLAIDSRGRHRMVPAERIEYSIDGTNSYVVRVDADIRAFIVDGTRLTVPSTQPRF